MTNSITCYLDAGWKPHIRQALPTRNWMDRTPFSYRCLPLGMANSHGWEILTRAPVRAEWNGGKNKSDLRVTGPALSWFGDGVVTFLVEGLFRTPPDWNLWVSGTPNHIKHGIQALTGLIETDWSPYTFTMNWKMTAPGVAEFAVGEPFCFFFPVERDGIKRLKPKFAPMDHIPNLKRMHDDWATGRHAFHDMIARDNPQNPAEQWEKHYMQGKYPDGRKAPSHLTKIKLENFE